MCLCVKPSFTNVLATCQGTLCAVCDCVWGVCTTQFCYLHSQLIYNISRPYVPFILAIPSPVVSLRAYWGAPSIDHTQCLPSCCVCTPAFLCSSMRPSHLLPFPFPFRFIMMIVLLCSFNFMSLCSFSAVIFAMVCNASCKTFSCFASWKEPLKFY